MNQSLQGVMTIASAPLGALALAFLPIEGALMIDVITAVLGITPLFIFHIPQPRPETNEQPKSILHDIREGAYFIYHYRGLSILYAVTGLVVLPASPTAESSP